MPNSPPPFIKNEPSDNSSDFSGKFSHHTFSDAYSISGGQYHHQSSNFGQGHYESIDPSALTMSSDMSNDHQGSMPRNIPIPQHGGFVQSYPNFGPSQGMGYMISDDELLSLDLTKNDGLHDYSHTGADSIDGYDLHSIITRHEMPLSHHDSGYSQTPDNAPGEPTFVRPFQGHQFRMQQSSYNSAAVETPSSYASPIGRSASTQGSEFDNYMNANGKRQSRHGIDINGSRKSPLSKSPHTPKTPGIAALSLNGTDSSSLPPQPIQNHHMGLHRHHKSLPNGQWDGTPSSHLSYMDSPLSSPGVGSAGHAQISELMKSAKHASLPNKVESPASGGPSYQTQEAKRRRRRESHNMVERRRRDNINERIQELSHLVPAHRLEDEKIRKHLQSNSPLSPTIGASGMSPPRATSMLAGGVGRRASGVGPTPGLPGDEKDKGPNKGDILNGAVGWTRDLMWCLQEKLKQEEKIKEFLAANGLQYPFEEAEEEKRMRSEVTTALDKNSSATRKFTYSRAPGTGLRVPGYTDLAGSAITVESSRGTTSISPVHAAGRNGSSGQTGLNGGARAQSRTQFWPNGNDGGITFKEEEFTMDLS